MTNVYLEMHCSGEALLFQPEGMKKDAIVLNDFKKKHLAKTITQRLLDNHDEETVYVIAPVQEKLSGHYAETQVFRDIELYETLLNLGVLIAISPEKKESFANYELSDLTF